MSKPIKLTDELLQKIQEEFVEKVKSMKMFDGKLKYEREFKWDDSDNDRATVYLSSVAFAKMNALIQQFDSEVAWHGVVERDQEDPSIFRIVDILVYPQIVTGTTVNTDQEAYQTWLYSFDDDVFNNMRMQGHSHVNMSVSPSGVDTTHQEKILEQIAENDYYIFMIWNKKYDRFVRIFDLKNNTLYETADVDVLIGDTGVDLKAFIEESKKIAAPRTYTTPASTYGDNGYQGYQKPAVVTPVIPITPQAAAPATVKSKPKNASRGSDIGRSFHQYGGAWDDDDPDYNGLYLGG